MTLKSLLSLMQTPGTAELGQDLFGDTAAQHFKVRRVTPGFLASLYL